MAKMGTHIRVLLLVLSVVQSAGASLYERSYPPIGACDTVIASSVTGELVSIHGKGHLFKDSEVLEVADLSHERLIPTLDGKPYRAKVSSRGRVVIQQQATRACTAAAVAMLVADNKGSIDGDALRDTDFANDEYMIFLLNKAGLNSVYTNAAKGLALRSEAQSERSYWEAVEWMLAENGPAIVGIGGEIGSHVIVLDSIQLATSSAWIRDPYHGWEIRVPLSSLYERDLDIFLQVSTKKTPDEAQKKSPTKSLKHEQIVAGLLDFERANLILPTLTKENAELFERTDLSADEKMAESFQNYLKFRLAHLSDEQRHAALRLLSERLNLKLRADAKEDDMLSYDSAFYDPNDILIGISLPQRYADSALYYMFLAHELEHGIQDRLAPSDTYPYYHPKHFSVAAFQREKGAMTAEGIYLLSLPKKVLRHLLLQVTDDSLLSLRDKVWDLEILLTAFSSRDVEAYVESQWGQGRYSRKQMLRLQFKAFAHRIRFMFGSCYNLLSKEL